MNELDLAYAAGFFDGEGCISIHRQSYDERPYTRPNYTLTVKVGNTNESIIIWFKDNFDGTICEPTRLPPRSRIWNWNISSNKAFEFIKIIYPYLKVKKPQADLAFEFMQNRTISKGWSSISKEERELRESYYEQMKVLNTKGRKLTKEDWPNA